MAMKPGMKMMLMQKATERLPQSEYTGNGNERRMIGYERPENNRRDGSDMRRYTMRDDYPESRYMPMGGWHEPPMDNHYPGPDRMPEPYAPENRRRRDRKGRYMVTGMDDDDEDDDYRPKSMSGNSYGDIYAKGTIYAPGAMNRPAGGGAREYGPVTEAKARKWVKGMSAGEKFPMDHTEPQRAALCPDCDPWEFYVAMNAMYSDHCATAKKMGMDKAEFYAALAKDFLTDEDAAPHKLQRYMENIPKK